MQQHVYDDNKGIIYLPTGAKLGLTRHSIPAQNWRIAKRERWAKLTASSARTTMIMFVH